MRLNQACRNRMEQNRSVKEETLREATIEWVRMSGKKDILWYQLADKDYETARKTFYSIIKNSGFNNQAVGGISCWSFGLSKIEGIIITARNRYEFRPSVNDLFIRYMQYYYKTAQGGQYDSRVLRKSKRVSRRKSTNYSKSRRHFQSQCERSGS